MADIILDNIYLILLIPFWIFLIIMLGRFFSVYVNKIIIYALTLFSSLLGIGFTSLALLNIQDKILETSVPFIKINDFIISAGFHVDKTALIFAVVLFVVSFLVQLFSIPYMKNEKKTYRFYAFLNLFNFAMSGLFFSANLFQMYVFWELVGVISYLLIGFEYFKTEKSIASKKVFIINRIGDTALITGIILSSNFMYSYSENWNLTTLSFVDMNIISTLLSAYTSTPLFLGICLLFITAAAVKSAQFPFYNWLQDAMEAKLPVSALLHSATMVASGVFLIHRLYPFFTLEPSTLKFITGLGLLTAIICSLSACVQTQPKKVLAYSTSAQLGLMFFAIGIGNLKGAFVFFVAHALIKAGLFLCLPNITPTQTSQSGEGVYTISFTLSNFIIFLLGGLSLCGIIFSGMVAKEFLYMDLNIVLKTIFCLISFLTTFYIIKIALLIGVDTKNKKIEIVPLIFTILNIAFYFYIRKIVKYEVSYPFFSALTAWACVYVLYIKNAFFKIPVLYPLSLHVFFLDKFYTKIGEVYTTVTEKANLIDVKFFANYTPIINITKFGIKLSEFIETRIMDGTVKKITDCAKGLSKFELIAQNGNIQRYNAYAFIITTVIITCLLICYISVYSYYMGG